MRFENRTVLSDSDTVTHEALRVREKRVHAERRSVQLRFATQSIGCFRLEKISIIRVRNESQEHERAVYK